MAVQIFRSSDTSAPQISGTVGSLIGVLDACLVNGYGAKTPLGWTKPFSGTNVAAYKMSLGSQMYLGVDDTGTQGSRVRGFSSMPSAWSSALGFPGYPMANYNPFPNDSQASGGCYVYKSATANATARSQVLISNGRIIYLWVDCNSDGGASSRVFVFGDIASYNSNEKNPCILIASQTANYYNYFADIRPLGTNLADHFLANRYDNLQWSAPCGKIATLGASGAYWNQLAIGYTQYAIQYPDMAGGGLIMSPIVIFESNTNGSILRGRLPGLQEPCHAAAFKTGDTITGGAGTAIAGRTFEAFNTGEYANSYAGVYFMETSDTWDAINFR